MKRAAPGFKSESAVSFARLASNLEVFGRGLTAIGNLFVFHCLSFVERGKASFLDRGNMYKNVLAPSIGLDKSKALGRVEPLHSTFSHYVVSAGSKNKRNADPRKPAYPTIAGYAVCDALDSLNGASILAEIDLFSGFLVSFVHF
jgi:hypothetical protein